MTKHTFAARKSSYRSIPITAICHIEDTDLVVSGRGGLAQISIIDTSPDAHLTSIDLLGDASIHGFVELSGSTDRHVLLCWGANVVRVFEVVRQKESFGWTLIAHDAPFKLTDWVLSTCIISEGRSDSREIPIALLDGHNEVHFLMCNIDKHTIIPGPMLDKPLNRRQVMLYHGHVCMVDGCLTVASGTMFGQVLFEAYRIGSAGSQSLSTLDLVARDIFHHHEGSVFGVQVLNRLVTTRGQAHYRLASCSDDRTIRVYEIPDNALADAETDSEGLRTGFTDFLDLPTATPSANTGHAMGHESRIWTVLWLGSTEKSSSLMSFGEDTTAQTWVVEHTRGASSTDSSKSSTTVSHAQKYGYHSGKNIWAASVLAEDNYDFRICTGGADGRVVSYIISTTGIETLKADRYTIPQDRIALLTQAQAHENPYEHDDTEHIFCSLEGRWKLTRSVVSQRTDYPSGDFLGEAVMTQRTVTENGYDNEILYEEQGQLVLANGLTFPAKRNYVYRYQRSSDTITAWFVKPDETTVVDYLFHQVVFKDNARRRKAQDDGLELAEGYHLCVADHYNASYEFVPGRNGLDRWNLAYHVKGPQKDYVAKSTFLPAEDKISRTMPRLETNTASQHTNLKADSYRSYTWLNEKQCLAATEHGRILLATLYDEYVDKRSVPQVGMLQLAQLPQLASHSITCTISPTAGLIAAGNGDLFHYSNRTQSVTLTHSFTMKITSLIFVEENCDGDVTKTVLVKCLKEACLHLLYIGCDGQLITEAELEVTRGYLPMSATFIDEKRLLAIGSRIDGLSLWRIECGAGPLQLDAVPSCQSLRLHGANAITAIARFGLSTKAELEQAETSQKSSSLLFATAGRDGMIMVHRLLESTLETVHALKWNYGPDLVGLSLGSTFVLWGFDKTDFVVVDFPQNTELMRVPCGNAHRNWAFRPSQTFDRNFSGRLVWTQANACHFYVQPAPSHTVLASGGHGREIKAVAAFNSEGQDFVATGAEDTDIKIFRVGTTNSQEDDTRKTSLQCIATLSKHQTGLTHLSFIGDYLFSAGGKEELFAWRIEDLPAPIHLGVYLQAQCPKVENGLLRITDVCQVVDTQYSLDGYSTAKTIVIAVTYSDSSLRLWEYTTSPPAFRPLASAAYGQNCLTSVRPLETRVGERYPRLLTAGTDGSLAVWQENHSKTRTEVSEDLLLLDRVQKIKTHDNAIKALLVKELPRAGAYFVVTGGDDGSVAMQILSAEDPGGYEVKQTRIPRAHAAAVNAVELVRWEEKAGNVSADVATTGSDQKVALWTINLLKDPSVPLSIQRRRYSTAVADASGLVKVGTELLIVGVGMEMMDVIGE